MNLEKYNACFMNIFEVSKTELNQDFVFGQVSGWDSLAHMELIAALEEEFDIMFDANDIIHFGSYENGKIILSKYGVEI